MNPKTRTKFAAAITILLLSIGGSFVWHFSRTHRYEVYENGTVIFNRDISLLECKTTTDGETLYFCAFKYSIQNKDPSICDLMDKYPEAKDMMKNWCIANYIETYKDTSPCKTMTPDFSDHNTYYDIACGNYSDSNH